MGDVVQYPDQRYVARCSECQGVTWELVVDSVEINKIEAFYCIGCGLQVDVVLPTPNQEAFEVA